MDDAVQRQDGASKPGTCKRARRPDDRLLALSCSSSRPPTSFSLRAPRIPFCPAAEPVGERMGKDRRQVLHNADREREAGQSMGKDLSERSRAARRYADDQDFRVTKV